MGSCISRCLLGFNSFFCRRYSYHHAILPLTSSPRYHNIDSVRHDSSATTECSTQYFRSQGTLKESSSSEGQTFARVSPPVVCSSNLSSFLLQSCASAASTSHFYPAASVAAGSPRRDTVDSIAAKRDKHGVRAPVCLPTDSRTRSSNRQRPACSTAPLSASSLLSCSSLSFSPYPSADLRPASSSACGSDANSWTNARRLATKTLRILLCGPERAGKTSILYRLKLNSFIPTTRTRGTNKEFFERPLGPTGDPWAVICWDIGQQEDFNLLLTNVLKMCDSVMFVVDACNPRKTAEARSDLLALMFEEHFVSQQSKFLILANKQDMNFALTAEDVDQLLDLPKDLRSRWLIAPCSAMSGEGLLTGLSWLAYGYPENAKDSSNVLTYDSAVKSWSNQVGRDLVKDRLCSGRQSCWKTAPRLRNPWDCSQEEGARRSKNFGGVSGCDDIGDVCCPENDQSTTSSYRGLTGETEPYHLIMYNLATGYANLCAGTGGTSLK